MNTCGKLFIISAPSGGGKTTIVTRAIKKLCQTHNIERIITYTTRPARRTDRHGIDYHFISEQEFQERIAQNFFLEWSGAYQACYGTPRRILDDIKQNKSYVAIVDRAGVQSLTHAYPAAIAIWLDVPSLSVLEKRLRCRNTETPEQCATRLRLAEQELASERTNPIYKYRILNDDLEKTVSELTRILYAELAIQDATIFSSARST